MDLGARLLYVLFFDINNYAQIDNNTFCWK